MLKKALTLAQLAMAFNGCEARLYCIGRDVYPIDWLANYIFKASESVRNKQFIHCPKRPDATDCSFFIGFRADEDEDEFFMIRGDNNDVLTDFCDIFVEYGKLLREDIYLRNESEEAAKSACEYEALMISASQIGHPNARTEFVYKEAEGSEYVIARFDCAVEIPFDMVEQRKIAADETEHSWGYEAENLSNSRLKDAPLSKIVARFLDPEGKTKPIEIPLRIDSSSLPAWLFDHALLHGLAEPPKSKKAKE